MVGRKLGIVIGTNEYSDSSILNLRFAEKDANEIKDLLLDPDICGFDEVIESINKTRTQTFCEIDQLLKKANHEDLLLIYYSGHGEPDPQNDLCLFFNNTKLDSLLPTSLNYSMVRKCMDASSCKTVIVVLDCCYSGAAGIKGNNLKEILARSSGSGTVILSASSEFDVAKEDEKLKNGVFTYYLLEGLRSGTVAGDSNGDIALVDLYTYAHEKTVAKYSQTPYLKIDCEGKIIIGKNPLKVKENNFISKRDKLVTIYDDGFLPPNVFDISMIVLVDVYEKPNELTKSDEKIRKSLEDLLDGKISVKTYIHTVQYYLKNEKIGSSHVLAKFIEQEIPKTLRNPEISKTFTSFSTDMEFVLIPAGKFMMGSPSKEHGRYDNESPVHEVTIKNFFYMGKYPVTQKQWKTVIGNNPSYSKGEDLPIESVTWNDVQEFIRELNKKEGTDKYRLPSEAEWEYACRAGTQTRYSFGDDESKLNEYAWYDKNSGSKTHPVGQKKPNFWGLYDMHGNVLEWVQDKCHRTYDGAPSDGGAWEDGDCSYRVYRGGGRENSALLCRSAGRAGLDCGNCFIYAMGFRLVRQF